MLSDTQIRDQEIRNGIRRAAVRMFREHPGWSVRHVAAALGVDDVQQVESARDELVRLGELPARGSRGQ